MLYGKGNETPLPRLHCYETACCILLSFLSCLDEASGHAVDCLWKGPHGREQWAVWTTDGKKLEPLGNEF